MLQVIMRGFIAAEGGSGSHEAHRSLPPPVLRAANVTS